MTASHRSRFLALVPLAVLLACGSDPATISPPSAPPPPPPVTSGVPTLVAMVTGDGQTAAPASPLPVPLSVVVRDGNGAAVPGVTVHFAIDTGGGSLSKTSVVTGADGIAGGVTWTLGGSGTNVVAVTVASLPAIRFHALANGATARTVISQQPVSAGGGTLTYNHAGDPLNGLTLKVPAGAYTGGSTWTIVADSTIAVPLPSGFTLAGPPLVIGNTQGYADAVMTLTVPLPINATIATAPFYFDPVTQLLEPITLVDRTATTATLATHHFSADLLALPDANGVSALRGNLRVFGNVVIVWVQTPLSQLVGTFTTGYRPGVDDWEYENWGDFISPGGDCEGMSITAMYYWYTFRRGSHPNSGLYHRYDTAIPNMVDNDQGIRFAGSVQGDYDDAFALGINQEASLTQQAIAAGANIQLLTSSWIALTIKLTRQPVLLGVHSANGGHAIVAYAVTVSAGGLTTVSISDPNQPGNTGVFMTFVNGLFTPTDFSTSAGTPASSYNTAFAIGVSGEVPIRVIAVRWQEFVAKTAGADRYPTGYTLEYQNAASGLWHPVSGHRLVIYDTKLELRTHCPSCAPKVDNPVRVWDAPGRNQVGYAPLTFSGTGTANNWIEMQAYNGTHGSGYLKADSLQILVRELTIAGPDPTPLRVQHTYTATNGPDDPGVHYKYTWDFKDGTAIVAIDDNPVARHTFTTRGHYDVTLKITEKATGELIAKATLPQFANNDIIFEFESATLTSVVLPQGGIGPEKSDTTVQGIMAAFINGLTTNPLNSLLYIAPDPATNCKYVVFEQWPASGTPDLEDVSITNSYGLFGSNCNTEPEFTTSLTFGPLGNGTIVGSAADSPNLPPDEGNIWHGGSINATMSQENLNGTFTWRIQYSTGIAVYTFTFHALQIVP